MTIRRVPRRRLITAAANIVLLGCIGILAITMGNDLICSTTEERAMSEFLHYDGVEPDWESNLKITGGCTTSYTADANPEEVRAYYRKHLEERGWSVIVGPSNSFPIHLEAERDGLRYVLRFEGGDPFALAREEQVLRAGTPIVMQFDGFELRPGQTRVSITGGHRR